MPVVGTGAIGGALSAVGIRLNPINSYNFNVEIEGVLVAGFTQASGLEATSEVFQYPEGGRNENYLVFPGRNKYSDIKLTHGVTVGNALYNWHMETAQGNIQRKNATIYMLNSMKVPLKWWNLSRVFPTKWTGPSFDASKGAVAVEMLTLAHEGMEVQPNIGI